MVEVALAQVEARCARGGDSRLHIAGLYHANRSMKDSTQVRWSDLCKLYPGTNFVETFTGPYI